MPKKEHTVGELIDASYRLREKRKALDKQVAELKRQEETVKEALIAKLGEQGLTKSSGTLASAGLSRLIYPRTVDFEEFFTKVVLRTKDSSLLERRVSAARFRELLEERGKRGVPGLEPFEKVNLTLRKL